MSVVATGVDAFIKGLRECGVAPTTRHGVVVFSVDVVGGALDGSVIETGVSATELHAWPAVPPHWVHLPGDVRFAHSNTQPSEVPGWTKHSRGMAAWGDAKAPAQAYLAHVRGVLSEAA